MIYVFCNGFCNSHLVSLIKKNKAAQKLSLAWPNCAVNPKSDPTPTCPHNKL